MRKRIFIFLGVLAVIVLSGVALWRGEAAAAGASPLYIAPEDLEFGAVWANAQIDRAVQVTNVSEAPVHVRDIRMGCSCISVSPKSFSLAPGSSERVHLHLNASVNPLIGKSTTIDASIDLVPLVDANGAVRQLSPWRVTASIQKAVSVSATKVDFGASVPVKGPYATKEIEVACAVPLKRLDATTEAPFIDVDVVQYGDDPQRYRILVKPADDAGEGPLTSAVHVSPVLENGETAPKLSLSIEGAIAGDMRVLPKDITLGAARLHEERTATVTLQSVNHSPIDVIPDHTSHDDITVVSKSLDGNAAIIRIAVPISGEGMQHLNLRLRVTQNGRSRVLTIPVTYYGRAPK
jgi:hypothetical protein